MKLRHPVVFSFLALLLAGSSVQATTYTFSKTSAGTVQWAAGTNWTSVPVGAVDTTLTFSGTLAASTAVKPIFIGVSCGPVAAMMPLSA